MVDNKKCSLIDQDCRNLDENNHRLCFNCIVWIRIVSQGHDPKHFTFEE